MATSHRQHFYSRFGQVSMTVPASGQAAQLLAAGEEEEDAVQMPQAQGWHL